MFRPLPTRQDLARIDAYTLGEAVDARLSSLTAPELLAFAHASSGRAKEYYRHQLAQLLEQNRDDHDRLRTGLISFYRSNPRALEQCEPAFVDAVLRALPADELAIELDGDDTPRRNRPVLIAAALAVFLVAAGAAIDRAAMLASGARVQAAASAAPLLPVAAAAVPTSSPRVAPARHNVQDRSRPHPTNARVTHSARRGVSHPKAKAHANRAARHKHAQSHRHKSKHHRTHRHRRATTVSYSAVAANSATLKFPAPAASDAPRRRPWLLRQLDHLNPFKPWHKTSLKTDSSSALAGTSPDQEKD